MILPLLAVALVGGVLTAALWPKSFAAGSVHVGDFVKVNQTGRITGKLTRQQALDIPNGRRVTAREDRADPAICNRFHAQGRADVETRSSISFCLVRADVPPANAVEPTYTPTS